MSDRVNLTDDSSDQFPRSLQLPKQSPIFWVQQKDRYLRQLLIRDIERVTKRPLAVYFANRFKPESQIDHGDIAYMAELLWQVRKRPLDLLVETNGGFTDATEGLISLLKSSTTDLRVIVINAAKSNGTMICLAANEIIMGPTSELGPIDPHLDGIPTTILIEPQIAAQNYPLHRLAQYAIQQTEKLATQLLKNGMLKGQPEAKIKEVVRTLSTREVFHSHGSVIDHLEASTLGLNIKYLVQGDELWDRLWLLYCMYSHDLSARGYLKVFEGAHVSMSIAASK